MKKILVVLPVKEHHKTYLEEKYPAGEFIYSSVEKVTIDIVKSADIIIGNVPAEMVSQCGHLELMQLNTAGTETYVEEGVLKEGTILANATGAYGLAVAEHMFAMTYMLMKKLNHYYENQSRCQWKDEGAVASFYQSRTLVIGLGDIGCDYAKRAKAMGSYVVGIKRRFSEKPDCVDELHLLDNLETELSKADIVAMFLPGTKETYHIMDENMLNNMKQGAILVNGGRGTAIDKTALKNMLDKGYLAGAALDVTEPEPLPEDDPLWKAKNILITPHTSGGYHLPETLERIVRIAGENLEAFYNGKEIRNVVDMKTGYKK